MEVDQVDQAIDEALYSRQLYFIFI